MLVMTLGAPVESTYEGISTEGMAVKVVSGVPPGQDFSDYAGDKVPEFVENEGQSKTNNAKYAKYNSLKSVIPQYNQMQVFTDEKKNEHDIVLGKKSVSADARTNDILNSQNHIWITKNAHREHVELDVYTTVKLNDGYRLVDINDEIKNAPLRDMMQLVDTDGKFIAIAPLDMWFVTSDYSYTIRGHLTESQAIELANKILELEN
jgi:hypothetical protein